MAFTDSALFPAAGPPCSGEPNRYAKIKVRKAFRKRFYVEYLGTNLHLVYSWQSRSMLGVAAF